MIRMKLLFLPALLGMGSIMTIVPSASSQQASLQIEHRHANSIISDLPPPPKNPDRTTGGGRRDNSSCPQDDKSETRLIALSPVSEPGATLAAYPTFWVSVPSTRAQRVEFSLFDQNKRGIYQTTFALTGTPGIVSFTLPSSAPPLSIGNVYTWVFALICDPADRRRDRLTSGEIRRIELNSTQQRQIERATPRERIALYRQAGIWYETVSILVEQQRSQPNALTWKTAWRELLQSGGLDSATIQPK
jgi:hypothetical protein